MIDHPTRREFLIRSALLAAGVSSLPLLRPTLSTARVVIPAEDLVDAGETFRRGSARGVALGPGPDATVLRPARDGGVFGRTLAVTSREQWGANEKYRFDRRGRELWPEMFVPAKKLIVHHTATRNDYRDAAEAAAEVRAIYYYHAVTQRWGDIGYTALIDRFGNLYEGRHGRGEGTGREYLSAGVVAGHDSGYNYGSAGVALLGDATRAGWPMTADNGPMWDALVRFGVFEAGPRPVPPPDPAGAAASSDFLRSDNVWTASMRNVSGHNETNNTACPGDAVMALLDELRGAVHAGLADTSRTGVTLANRRPGGRETTVGTTIAYEWAAEQPESGWGPCGCGER